MRAVARRLVLDEARVDDVVQQTWLAALERPPRHRRGLRAWLGVVARNFALRHGREEGRRRRRERTIARPESVPGPDDVVVQLEAHRRVVDAVLGLDEPYRTTILLRFYRALKAKEIGARMGVKTPTVRTRLRRALVLLRERLDRAHGGDRRAWSLALLPLAVRRAPHAATAAVAVTVPLLVAGAIVAGTLAVTRGGPGDAAPRRAPPDVPVARTAAAAAHPASAAPTAPPEPPAAGAPFWKAREGAAPPGTVEGVVFRDGRPVGGGTALLLRYRNYAALPVPWHDEPGVRRTHVASDGSFRFAGLEPGAHAVAVRAGSATVPETYLWTDGKSRTPRVMFVLADARVAGQVFDDLGRAVAGAPVQISSDKESLGGHRFSVWAETGPDGAFVAEDLPAAGYYVGVNLAGSPRRDGTRALTRFLTVGAGETATVHLGRVRPLPTWSGVVRARTGEPVRGPGRIQIQPKDTNGYSYVYFDEQGRFAAPVLPGEYDVFVHLPGVRFVETAPVAIPETDAWQDVACPGARVRVLGAPAGASVQLQPTGETGVVFHPVIAGGPCVIDGVPPGRYRVRCGETVHDLEVADRDATLDLR